jgi:hypothetical protein
MDITIAENSFPNFLLCRHVNEKGQLHHETEPAVVKSFPDGIVTKEWYQFDKLHRPEGPAIEISNGYSEYWLNGYLHRLNGPAIVTSEGLTYYYIESKQYEKETYLNAVAKYKLKQLVG